MCVCKGCAFEYEWKQGDTSVPVECIGCQVMDGKPTNFKPKPMTNADRIRAMSDEELAERLIFWNDDWGRWETDAGNFAGDPNDTKETAIKAELEWLKQPAEVDNG